MAELSNFANQLPAHQLVFPPKRLARCCSAVCKERWKKLFIMRIFLPLLALCAGCSPAGPDHSDANPAPTRAFSTQTEAPSPDYAALLGQPVAGGEGRTWEATSSLPPNAKAIGDLWIARLQERRALLGHRLAGKTPDGPVEMIDMGLTEQEFKAWVMENEWRVPGHIRWSFVPEMSRPPVSQAAQGAIRVWPASKTRTGIQLQALFYGKVVLRDGCFFVGFDGQPADKLAWFHSEMGLHVDPAGYFILRDRVSGRTLARLGEDMSWGGPASADIDTETEQALQDACGPGEVYIVGSPEARERFLTQYPHLREPMLPPLLSSTKK
ncbi:hypothetical protein [Sphingosinicella soli]|uniref:Uncharacterized protein n=1 Tax=Sphingosinicella soli TaxID=333708 RepID=A0A7W7B6L1_9SPHN|nr:hypothetical protein [Sphingosinicella soli]MBB4633975.1 hypothetical protein [Sphingosinicella soli]